jgi:hypothetical protein
MVVLSRLDLHLHLHLPRLLLVGVLVSSPASAQPAAVKAGTGPAVYPGQGYYPGEVGAHGGYPPMGGGEPMFDYALPRQDAGRGPEGAVAPPPGYGAYPALGESSAGGFPGGGFVTPSYPGVSRADVRSGPESGRGVEGYRFRGDKDVPEGQWRESPLAPGYKFRPLAPAELDRSEGADGWRPLGRDDRRAPQKREPERGGTDAYGYESDSWFRKHYGERP